MYSCDTYPENPEDICIYYYSSCTSGVQSEIAECSRFIIMDLILYVELYNYAS